MILTAYGMIDFRYLFANYDHIKLDEHTITICQVRWNERSSAPLLIYKFT